MIRLRNDLFSRLAISANKDKHLNKPFRVSHVDFDKMMRSIKARRTPVKPDTAGLDSKVSELPISIHSEKINAESALPKIQPHEKIDEKVDSIINNPVLAEIKLELEFAERLLVRIKDADKDNPKIPVLERNVSQLRALLEQKMYV